MLVCLCKGISDRRIHEEIRRGNGTMNAIQHGCEAGTDCGQCVNKIRHLLTTSSAELREKNSG
jgi:bacterioferritin-associated ferredoxin